MAWPRAQAQNANYDVIVYGGSSAGVIAATQAAHMGKSTLLIVPGQHFGGVTASGLGTADIGVAETIGGLARDFFGYLGLYYRPAPAGVSAAAAGASEPRYQFEPHVAEAVFTEMLRGSGAKWVFGEQLERKGGVSRRGRRLASLLMKSGRQFSGTMFIDATYEGDLLAAAGVSYRLGRERRGEFGESLAGVCRNPDPSGEVTPYRVPHDPASGLLPGVAAAAPGPDGSGDNRIQQYNFRLCLTDVPANRIPIGRPDGYDASHYQLLARRLQQHPEWTLSAICKMQPVPGGKVDVNNNGLFSTDMAGDESSHWPEASDDERAAIFATYRNYTQGLFWFLAHDPVVPRALAAEAARWGFAKDEFADSGHWPWQLYVREARRMIGAYLITQRDCERAVAALDSIALGSYAMDSHAVTLFADDAGVARSEGFFFAPVEPYPISYRAIVPRANECTNLLVPICLSATHVAFNSIRMEPVFMMLGQSAATAACLAIDQGSTVQDVNYAALAQQLKADGQILAWPAAEANTASSPSPALKPTLPDQFTRFGAIEP